MARKRRKRLKWYAGGGAVLALLFLLGDPYGLFRADDRGPERADSVASKAGDPRPSPERPSPSPASRPRPDAELAADVPRTDPPPADTPPADAPPADAPPAEDGTGAGSRGRDSDDAASKRKDAARHDELMGIIARYEGAISADDVAGLAVLVDRVRARPITAPAALEQRWKMVQARADAVLECGERIRSMVRQGEILQVERLIEPILESSTPQWMRARLDAAMQRFGWPVLSRDWRVVNADRETGEVTLAKMRRVRFVRDGELHEGTLWRSDATRATVRVTGTGGFTFPVVPRSDVEPVSPEPDEALAQGVAAARARAARRVALWSCHFHERGETANETRLRALIR